LALVSAMDLAPVTAGMALASPCSERILSSTLRLDAVPPRALCGLVLVLAWFGGSNCDDEQEVPNC